jgi:transposase
VIEPTEPPPPPTESHWVGLDVHKASCTATLIDPRGKEQRTWKFETSPEELARFAQELPPATSVALEASTVGKAVYRFLSQRGLDVHMGNPRALSVIATAEVKTDARDSFHLGQLLRTNYFPECYVPPMDLDEVRQLVRYRMDLGESVAEVKNKLHALVSRNLFDSFLADYSDLFGREGLERLVTLPWPPNDRELLTAFLERLQFLLRQAEEAERRLARLAEGNHEVELLMTIPGVGFYAALGILGEVGEVRRFPTKKHLYSFAGVVPRADNSGEQVSLHRHVKRGDSVLKFFLTCAVQGALRAKRPNAVAQFYRRKAKQLGRPKALVAATRKMAGVVWGVLTHNEPYAEEDPRLTVRKTEDLALKARRPLPPPTTAEELQTLVMELGSKRELLDRLLEDPKREMMLEPLTTGEEGGVEK